MADNVNAEVLEVVAGQIGQYRGIDRILAKRVFVLRVPRLRSQAAMSTLVSRRVRRV